MKISLYTISKSMPMTPLEWHYQKLCKSFSADICVESIFNTDIDNAQKNAYKHNKKSWDNKKLQKAQNLHSNQSFSQVKSAYTKALAPLVDTKLNSIALHPLGIKLDSIKFAKLIEQSTQNQSQKGGLNFFIAGAYGFDDEFLSKTTAISLSDLTFSHKIVRLVLLEQIYRALSIIHHHPYHK